MLTVSLCCPDGPWHDVLFGRVLELRQVRYVTNNMQDPAGCTVLHDAAKGFVEQGVLHAERRVLAPLRNHVLP